MNVIEFEYWLTVEAFPAYEVSNLGRVRNRSTRHILKPAPNSKGYLCVLLYNGSKDSRKSFLVHRLVADAFLPNISGLQQVNHLNGQKGDNRVANLEWCDQLHNIRHAISLGLRPMLLSDGDVRAIRREYRVEHGRSNVGQLSQRYGVAVNTVKGIVHRVDRAGVAA